MIASRKFTMIFVHIVFIYTFETLKVLPRHSAPRFVGEDPRRALRGVSNLPVSSWVEHRSFHHSNHLMFIKPFNLHSQSIRKICIWGIICKIPWTVVSAPDWTIFIYFLKR